MNIRSLFKRKKTRFELSYDTGYVDGSYAERARILEMMDKLIDKNKFMPNASLLIQARNTLANHKTIEVAPNMTTATSTIQSGEHSATPAE